MQADCLGKGEANNILFFILTMATIREREQSRRKAGRKNKSKGNTRRRNQSHRRNNTSRKKGGAVIGAGAFGCVFRPPLRCPGEVDAGDGPRVTKLMSSSEADHEYNMITKFNKTINTIPNHDSFFLTAPVSLCNVDPELITQSDLVPAPETEGCDITVEELQSNPGNFKLLQLPDGGIPLRIYIEEAVSDWDEAECLQFISHMTALLLGGIVPANEKGLYNMDVKGDNIVVDGKGRPRLIDWGTGCQTDGCVRDARLLGAPTLHTGLHAHEQYNVPCVVAMAFEKACFPKWKGGVCINEGDETGILREEWKRAMAKPNLANIRSLVNDFISTVHGTYLLENILNWVAPGKAYMTLFEYTIRNVKEYTDTEGNFKADQFYANFYNNVDPWGWAMTVSMLQTGKGKSWTLSAANMRRRVAKYLFEEGAIRIDPGQLARISLDIVE